MDYQTNWLKMLCCAKCRTVPLEGPIYNCIGGHTICSACLEKIQDDEAHICPECNQLVLQLRNYMAEEMLKHLKEQQPQPQEKVLCRNPSTVTMVSSDMNLNEAGGDRPQVNEPFVDSMITNSSVVELPHTSRRPIVCPNSECQKTVALTTLISHFSFDHKDIPQICTELGECKYVTTNVDKFDSGKSESVALFMIPLQSRYIHAIPPASSRINVNDGTKSALVLIGAKVKIAEKTSVDDEDNAILVLWLSGNADCNLMYTITAMDNEKTRSYSFTGPLHHFHNQSTSDARIILETGDCLVLYPSSLQAITPLGEALVELRIFRPIE